MQVGLLRRGNEEQIPLYALIHISLFVTVTKAYYCSAYELYASLPELEDSELVEFKHGEDSPFGDEDEGLYDAHGKPLTKDQKVHHMADAYKKTFSQHSVKVHFVGVWYVYCVIVQGF